MHSIESSNSISKLSLLATSLKHITDTQPRSPCAYQHRKDMYPIEFYTLLNQFTDTRFVSHFTHAPNGADLAYLHLRVSEWMRG